MNKNKLKLNDENKNELLVIGDRIRLSLVRKGLSWVTSQTSAKYLGVHLDETLSMNEQISSLCRSFYFHLRKIGSIRSYLSDSCTAELASSLNSSRLDYCNSTLSSLPFSPLKRLQKIQINPARLILHSYYSPSEAASLAPYWSPHPLQKLLHLLSGTLGILLLPVFHNCFKSINPPELFGLATKNSRKFPKPT